MPEGIIWPSEQDKQPKRATFLVSQRSLESFEEDEVREPADIVKIVITEDQTAVEDRLTKQFPLYRLAKFGQSLIAQTKGVTHEI